MGIGRKMLMSDMDATKPNIRKGISAESTRGWSMLQSVLVDVCDKVIFCARISLYIVIHPVNDATVRIPPSHRSQKSV